jgi:hypothetical protein
MIKDAVNEIEGTEYRLNKTEYRLKKNKYTEYTF